MISKEELSKFLINEFPQSKCEIIEMGGESATIKHTIGHDELRPGGTVAGPVLMLVADVALYVAIHGEIGLVPLAVTTNLNINFIRKPSADKNIIGVCKLLKVGRSLAVGEVNIYSEGDDKPVAHVVGTYSIPPNR
ncbi:MAG: thioesterase [Kangiella sp.]|nr:MAG: thioesterase [Kangiella sp.]